MDQQRYRVRANMLPSGIDASEFAIDQTYPEAELVLDNGDVGGPIRGVPVVMFSSDERRFTIRGRSFHVAHLADGDSHRETP